MDTDPIFEPKYKSPRVTWALRELAAGGGDKFRTFQEFIWKQYLNFFIATHSVDFYKYLTFK